MRGPGRGPTIWCIVRSLTLFLHKRLFPGLEPVTFQSHDNNFTSCTRVTPRYEYDLLPYFFHDIQHINIIFLLCIIFASSIFKGKVDWVCWKGAAHILMQHFVSHEKFSHWVRCLLKGLGNWDTNTNPT